MDILTSIETVMDSDLLHYGRKGMKWGVRNGPPYPLHPEQLSPAEKKARRSVFISGSSKTQFEDSGYYRKELPKAIQNKIDEYIKDHARIIVGDAPGIDRQVQDYLNEKGYDAVEIYGPGKQVRYAANDKWKTNPVDAPEFEEMSPEWLRKKDIAMTNDATEGLAIVLDDGAQATRNNVARLREQGKQAEVFILNQTGDDDWEHTTGSYETLDKALERLTPVEKKGLFGKEKKPEELTDEQKKFLFQDENEKILTEAGRKVLKKFEDSNELSWRAEFVPKRLEKEGVKVLDGQYQLDKGAHVRRIASANETLDERPKHASITEDDAYEYTNWGQSGALGTDFHEKQFTYEFSTKRKFKIADEKQIVDYLATAYGGPITKQRVKDYSDYVQNRELLYGYFGGRPEPKWYERAASKYADAADDLVRDMFKASAFNRTLSPNSGREDLFSHFQKLGYDAIVDIEDAGSTIELPIIVLNPKKSLNLVKSADAFEYDLVDAYRDYQKSKTLSHSDFLSAVELVLPDDALQYGVLGQKWGIRKWQNKDGTLTPAGRERWINSLKQEAYAASKKWEEYQAVRKQVINMHYNGKFDNELEKKMFRLKDEAEEAGAIWGSLRKRIESYLENGPDVSTSEPVEDAPHKVLIPVSDEEKYKHFLDLGYVEKGRNDTWIYMVNHKKNIKHSDFNQNDVLAAVETVMDGDIEHHGRKGMKWGVRNGPPYPLQYSKMSPEERQKIPRPKLTKKEEAAYKEQIESKEAATAAKRDATYRKKRMAKAGLKQNEDGSYTLKEGSSIRRVSSEDDDKRTNAKYVSITGNDARQYDYDTLGAALGLQEDQTPYTYEFKAKKDLKIANEDDVLDFLLDKYANDTNRADIEAYQKQRGKDQIYVNAKHGKAEGWLWDYAYGVEKLARTFVHRELYDIDRVHQREVLDHFSSLGYDAIMDIEDRINRYDAPILIIDPESAMIQTRKEQWGEHGYNLKKSYKKSLSHSDFFAGVELVLPDDALQYGVLGQQWGVRHWQNKDGTLTPAGRERWINSLKQEAYAASKKWEEYQKVRKQVIDMHYNGKFDNELETKMRRLKDEADEAGAIWGSLRKRVESYLENGPNASTSEPVDDAPHKVLIPVSDEAKYKHFKDLGYVERGRNDTWIYMVNHAKNIRHEEIQNDVLVAVETVMDGDIEHHGRKGQKWGIRNGPPYPLGKEQLSARERMLDSSGKKNIAATGERKKWQKSTTLSEFAKLPYTGLFDDKLTKKGRKHMAEMLSGKELKDWGKATAQAKANSLKKAGIEKSEQGGHTMKVGSKLYRIADSTDQVDDKRKYVSATENDLKRYNEVFGKGFLALHKRDTATEFQYKGQKDIRVADADDVLGYVVDKYGGKREKQLLEDVRRAYQFRDALKELNITGLGTAADIAVANYLSNTAPMELRSFVKSQLWDGSTSKGKKAYADNKQSAILGHYRDLGYDAIVDVEDYLSGFEYPMIMIDPKKSISVNKKRALDPDMENPERRARLTEAGVQRQNKNEDVIAKGSTFTRQASADDDRYHDRKYMSITKKDTDYYRKEFGNDAEYSYVAKRKLKVASAQAVVDYIVKDMDNYGDSAEGKKLSEMYSKYRGDSESHLFQFRANKERDRFDKEVVAKQRTQYGREGEAEFNTHKQILDHFSQLGYDAIVDINQSWQGMDYPVIIIDPDDSTKLKTKITRRVFKDKVENF